MSRSFLVYNFSSTMSRFYSRILHWFRKDPLLHGIILLLAVPAIYLVIFFSLAAYWVAVGFNPNFEEYGPNIWLYKAQNCVHIERDYTQPGDCPITTWQEGVWKNNPDRLDYVVSRAVNQEESPRNPNLIQFLTIFIVHKPLPALVGYPKNANQWICSKNGQIIPDLSQAPAPSGIYKCWPE